MTVFDLESELLACAAGDRAAFFAIYHQESPTMRALAIEMLTDPDLADTVLHESFVLIWRNAAGFSPAIGTARAWMYSILRYRANYHARQARATGNYNSDQQPLPALNLSSGTNDPLGSALAALPQPQLDVLLQAYLHGGSTSHIAAKLDRTEPDILSSLEKSLQHIDQAVRA